MLEFTLLMAAGWTCCAVVCVIGINKFLKTERRRLDSIDRAVERAWRVVDRELNPPAPPTQEQYADMMRQSQAAQMAHSGLLNSGLQNVGLQQGAHHNAFHQQSMAAQQQQMAAQSLNCLSGAGLGGLFGINPFK